MRKSDPRTGDKDSSRSPEQAELRPSLPSAAVSLDLELPEGLLGTLLAGRYRLDAVIGTGGMSVVYRAEHVHMRKAFAVKVLHRELSTHAEIVARFEREAVAAASIDHPNIAGATDFGRLGDGSFYLVLEYVDGKSLADLLQRREPLPVQRALHVLRQVADALGAAHAQGIVHRDLKPENIMLVERPDDASFVKVLDFGIAKVTAEEHGPALTKIGSVFGTPQYMSPEQATGATADARSDLYSLGVLGYEMLTGYPPFGDSDVGSLLSAHVNKPAPVLPASIDPEIRRLIALLLQKRPDERLQSAAELSASLDWVIRRSGAPSELPPAVTLVPTKFPETFRLGPLVLPFKQVVIGAAVALLVFVGAIGALVGWLGASEDSEDSEDSLARGAASATEEPAAVASVIPRLPREVVIARAAVGDEEALRSLRRKLEKAPSAEGWLALGRGYARRKQYTEAMRAYEKALDLEQGYQADEVLLRDVRLAAREEESAEASLRVASRYLGAAGADILYDVWVSTPRKTPTTQLARQMVYDGTVREKASPALDVALDLRAAQRCKEFEVLLSRVILHGDQRVVRLLKPLQQKGGCGPGKREDCFPCLRDDAELLDAALVEASQRLRPRL